jgi:hypothetical protein
MGQAQTRFFVELEDWLFASTRGTGSGLGDEAAPEVTLQTLLEQTSTNIGHFQRIVSEAEQGRQQSAAAIQNLAQHIGQLAEAQAWTQQAISRANEGNTAMLQLLGRVEQALRERPQGDDVAHTHLAAIEATLGTIAADQARSRAQEQEEIRNELRRLARTIGVTLDDRTGG